MQSSAEVEKQNAYQFLSTNVSFKSLLEKYFPEADYGDENKWVDIHDKKLLALLALPRTVAITYHNSVPITTQSYRAYGTTSFWWLILSCSNYIHPHQIPTNTSISLPTLSAIASAISNTEIYTGLRGQVVTF